MGENERTMNINPLILTNVQGSPYFKVDHLEPWATGSRKTAGRSQTGMCGGVRGVSAGGIVSSCFCLLYKLYTLKVTKKQVYALIEHADSPYIRGVGFMYLRYTLPPQLMWDWFEPYLDDEEEIDIKAGGGKPMTIGEMCRLMLTRLEWFDTRFPRIAVNFEKQIRENLDARQREQQEWDNEYNQQGFAQKPDHGSPGGRSAGRASRDRDSKTRERERDPKSRDRESKPRDRRSRSRDRRSRSKHRKSRSRDRRSRSRDRRSRSRDRKSRSKDRKSRSKDRRSRSKDRKSRHRSRSRDKSRDRRDKSRSREKKKEKKRDRSRSRDRHHKKHKKERSRDRRRSTSRSRSKESKQKSKDDDYSKELKKFKDDASKMKKKSKKSRSRS